MFEGVRKGGRGFPTVLGRIDVPSMYASHAYQAKVHTYRTIPTKNVPCGLALVLRRCCHIMGYVPPERRTARHAHSMGRRLLDISLVCVSSRSECFMRASFRETDKESTQQLNVKTCDILDVWS